MASAKKHTVAQGECMSSIAFANGFFWQTLWGLPENAALRERRASPFVLRPGDEVHVPAPRPREVRAATNGRHVFRRKGVPARLRMRLLHEGEPLASLPFVLAFAGQTRTGTTTSDGVVDVYVPPDMPEATLTVGEGDDARVYTLAPRALDPVSDTSGVQARLASLGFYGGAITGELDDATRDALVRFQTAHELEPTGTADDATTKALAAAHSGK